MCQHDLLLLRRYLDHGYIRTGSGPRPKPSTEIERIGKKDVRNGSIKYYSRQILLPESLQPYFAFKILYHPPYIWGFGDKVRAMARSMETDHDYTCVQTEQATSRSQ